jgi:RNA polymerase sigma-70 factor (ECF subfamily)
MGESVQQSAELQVYIDRLQAGDRSARDELLGHASERLRRLTRKMLQSYPRVKRWELTDDVLQNALLRLWTALQQVTPLSVREFVGLASLQIRRELIDLAHRYYGPEGVGTHHSSHIDTPEPGDSTQEPGRLAVWTEFHQRVESLPEEEREAFDCLWYQGLTYREAATLLGISESTMKRRWVAARRRLHALLKGWLPEAGTEGEGRGS